jgi:ATP-dependent metalloprotease
MLQHNNITAIRMDIFEWAKDKILMGSERKTAVISAETARMTAYHEGVVAI